MTTDPVPKISMLLELRDKPGALHEVLRYFWKYDLNITRLESRPKTLNALGEARFDFFVDFESPSKNSTQVSSLLASLESMTTKAMILDEKVGLQTAIASLLFGLANATLGPRFARNPAGRQLVPPPLVGT